MLYREKKASGRMSLRMSADVVGRLCYDFAMVIWRKTRLMDQRAGRAVTLGLVYIITPDA